MAAEYSVDGLDRWEKAAGLIGGAAGAEQDVANERGYPRHIVVTKSLIFTLVVRQFRFYCKYRKSNSRNLDLDIVSPQQRRDKSARYLHDRRRYTAMPTPARCNVTTWIPKESEKDVFQQFFQFYTSKKKAALNCRFFSPHFLFANASDHSISATRTHWHTETIQPYYWIILPLFSHASRDEYRLRDSNET